MLISNKCYCFSSNPIDVYSLWWNALLLIQIKVFSKLNSKNWYFIEVLRLIRQSTNECVFIYLFFFFFYSTGISKNVLQSANRFQFRFDTNSHNSKHTFTGSHNGHRRFIRWSTRWNKHFLFNSSWSSTVMMWKIINQFLLNLEWWSNAIEEHSIYSSLPFDDSESGLWNGRFVPPPPRPPFWDDKIDSDGLTTCDLCTWALQDRNAFRIDGTISGKWQL